MKSITSIRFLAYSLALVVFISCKKNYSGGPAIITPDNARPDLTQKVSASVTGYVLNESGEPVPFAEVTAGDKRSTTDSYGFFSISNTSLVKSIGVVKVTRNGYYDGFQSFIAATGKESFLQIQLLPKTISGEINAANGGIVTVNDGTSVQLPAYSVVKANGSAIYDGQVKISTTSLAVSSPNFMPGDGRGTDAEGYLKALQFYGAVAVNLTASNGEALQIAEGKSSAVKIPIQSSLAASAPATIALWYFNETTGLWKQEGTAVKNGNVYEATVPHFSFWGVADAEYLVTLQAKIVDAGNNPLVHVPVSVRFAGQPKGSGHERFAYTDAEGVVSGAVFANSSLELDVLTTCAIPAYTHPFSTQNSDVDLGDIKGNLGQTAVTITGTAVNCNNQPVTNGYIQTYDGGFYNRIPVNNGSFSFTGLSCSNTQVSVVLVDNDSYQQNTPQSIQLVAGLNDLGNLTGCGTSTMGYITYTLDGVTTTIAEPVDTIGAYYLDQGSTQVLTLSGNPNTQQKMAFQFTGGTTIGGGQTLTEVYSYAIPGGRGYWPVAIPLTITAYGNAGGFVSGSFSSKLIDFNNSGVHDFECSFRIRRMN